MEEICTSQGKAKMHFTEKALIELKKMPWTGNVRELRNVVERLVILCDKEITDKDVKTYVNPIGE
jgi:DNA-binding NtrC family response regulator